MCPYYKVVNKTSTVLASIQRTEFSRRNKEEMFHLHGGTHLRDMLVFVKVLVEK